MNELKTFTFENRNVRTLTIDENPWFVGSDVAEILGYSNSRKAIQDHVDEEDKTLIQKSRNVTFEIPNRGMTIINESGLYSLILSSKLPSAKKFKRLFDDLKKQIRKRENTMNELKTFTFENRNVRTLMLDGSPWFVGKDVAEILGYQNPSKALKDHVDEDDKLNNESLSSLGQRGGWLVSESGLYSLILSSKLPSAKKFKRWVTSEVLPAIRKNGLYAMDELLDNPDLAIEALTKLKAEREARKALEFENTIQRQQIAELSPKAKYFDVIMDCKDTVPISIIAKDYGMSAKGMNELLHEKGVQYKVGNTWLLIQKWAAEGYTRTKTFPYVNNSGESKCNVQTRWTQEGRYFIYQTLKKDGILPLVERKC